MTSRRVVSSNTKSFIPQSLRTSRLFYLYNRLLYLGRHVEELLANTDIFFVMSTGRSGTQWLSSLLNRDEKALVLHEPANPQDRAARQRSKDSHSYAVQYLRDYRRYLIYEIIKSHQVGTYGEVTGTLRYNVYAIKQVLPDARLLLMTRDGRDVVRSTWNFAKIYGENSEIVYHLKPQTGEPFYDRWDHMSRFDKICWSWMHSNEYMLSHIPSHSVFQFERILSDYGYFQRKVLNPLGLHIAEETWREAVNRKSPNASVKYDLPHWRDWPSRETEAFLEICGPTMEKLGYQINI